MTTGTVALAPAAIVPIPSKLAGNATPIDDEHVEEILQQFLDEVATAIRNHGSRLDHRERAAWVAAEKAIRALAPYAGPGAIEHIEHIKEVVRNNLLVERDLDGEVMKWLNEAGVSRPKLNGPSANGNDHKIAASGNGASQHKNEEIASSAGTHRSPAASKPKARRARELNGKHPPVDTVGDRNIVRGCALSLGAADPSQRLQIWRWSVKEGAEAALREPDRKQLIGDGLAHVADQYDNFGLSTDQLQEELATIWRSVEAKAQEQAELKPSEKARQPTEPFALIQLDEIKADDEPAYLIPGLLPVGPALHVFFGPPKSLKSFVLMDIYLHIAAGIPYAGREVQQGAVVYVTNEGVQGVKRRLVAMRQHLGIEGKGVLFYLVKTMPNLGAGADDAIKLIAQIKKAIPAGVAVRAIAIDTLRRAIPGKDENATKDLSVFIANCGLIAETFACVTSAVHHSPRSDDGRSSGSNSLDGAADCAWGAAREGNLVTTTVHRMKDGPEEHQWSCSLHVMEIGTDKQGQPITSCAVNIVSSPQRPAAKPKDNRRDDHTELAWRFLNEAILEFGKIPPTNARIPKNTATITVDQWRQYCDQKGLSASDQKESQSRAFRRAKESLQVAGKIGIWLEHVWAAGQTSGLSGGQ
jgi:hypothetical protein